MLSCKSSAALLTAAAAFNLKFNLKFKVEEQVRWNYLKPFVPGYFLGVKDFFYS